MQNLVSRGLMVSDKKVFIDFQYFSLLSPLSGVNYDRAIIWKEFSEVYMTKIYFKFGNPRLYGFRQEDF